MKKQQIAIAIVSMAAAAIPLTILADNATSTATTTGFSNFQGLQMPQGPQIHQGLQMPEPQQAQYPDGPRLIKLEDSKFVYWVSPNNIKIPMWGDAVFKSYGNDPSDVQTVAQEEFNYYPDARFVRLIDSARIYKLDGWYRHFIPSAIWNDSGQDASEIIDINRTDFNSYKNGPDIKDGAEL